MQNQPLKNQLEMARDVVMSLSPGETAQLHAKVKAQLKRAIVAGTLPAAAGYHLVIVPSEDGQIHLGAELCNAQGEAIHDVVSVGEIEIELLELKPETRKSDTVSH